MKYRIPKNVIVLWMSLFLTLSACSEDSTVNPNYPDCELIIDSVSVYVVRGIHPDYGTPSGHFFLDIYYQLRGATGSFYRVELSPSPPGTNTNVIEHPGYYRNPQPINTPLELHFDLWLEYDYADYDSIGTYFSVTAKFWREYESHIRMETVRIPLGEDKKWLVLMVEVRDE